MPGPGSRRKAKPKAKRPKVATDDDSEHIHIMEIDNSESWDIIVNILYDLFDLPGEYANFNHLIFTHQLNLLLDLSTRSGLKKVHSRFEAIYGRIDAFYERNLDNFKIRGAIVAIYAKMCIDSILRNKLFQKGRTFKDDSISH